MIAKKINEIDSNDLALLVANNASESTTLEFKRSLPGTTDMDKKEFLADISALANTSGGDLIFGIEEEDGCANKICGVAASVIDDELLRLDNLISSGIEPRIRYEHAVVDCGDERVLILRAEKSWNSPHRVTLKGHDKFYARTSAGKYSLDVQQLRDAFLISSSIADKLRSFRTDRLIDIISGRCPVEMSIGSKLVLHLLPFEGFATNKSYDLDAGHNPRLMRAPMNNGSWGERITLEGRLAVSQYGSGHAVSYSHFYRNGIIEAVEDTILNHTNPGGQKNLPSLAYERIIIAALRNYCGFLKDIGVQGPVAIALSLTGVKGAIIGLNAYWHMVELQPILQDNLLLPETILQSLDDSPITAIRSSFDLVWNACGQPKSANFDEEGQWAPKA